MGRVPDTAPCRRRTLAAAFLLLSLPLASPAQNQAVLTADAFALGRGAVRLSVGAEHLVKDAEHPPGELRRLIRILPAALRIGVASNVDVVVAWRGRLEASTGDGTRYGDWGDPSFSTKIAFTDSAQPAGWGILFGVKIPSTRYLPARLGSDAMDVWVLGTYARRFSGGEIRLNAGGAILGDARFAGSQDDVFTGSLLALWRLSGRTALHAEAYGFTGPKNDDDKLQLRGGATVDLGSATATVYALARAAGSPVDYATAFEGSAEWGAGIAFSIGFGGQGNEISPRLLY